MKAIKISIENQAAIVAALKSVNGRAEAHAYSTFGEIGRLADTAEQKLADLGLPKALRAGAAWRETSGAQVAKSYTGFWRDATGVRLERRATGWFLVSAQRVQIGQQGGGAGRLIVTQQQRDELVARFEKQFEVAR